MKSVSYDHEMFLVSLRKLKLTLDHKEQEVLPPIQNDRLFKACVYLGNRLGFKVDHPDSQAELSPNEIDSWMQVLAERSKIAYRPFELKGKWWKSIVDPFIVFEGDNWQANVVIPKGDRGAVLVDIETGARTSVDAEVAAKLKHVAYMFYEVLPEKTKGVWDLCLLGFRSLKGHWKGLFTVLLLLEVATLATPLSNQLIFDYVIPNGNTSLFWQLTVSLILVNFTSTMLGIVRSLATLRYRTIIENKMQAALWDRFLNFPISIFNKFQRGDLIQRMMLVDHLRPFLMGNAVYTIIGAPFAVLYLLLMLSYSAPLGLMMTVVLFVFYAMTFSLRLYILPLLKAQLQKSADLNSFLIQMVTGISKLRMAAAGKRAFSRWAHLFADYQQMGLKIGMREISFTLLSTLYPVVSLAITYGMAVYFLKGGEGIAKSAAEGASGPGGGLTMGQFVAFQSAFTLLSGSVGGIMQLMSSYMETMQSVRRTDQLLTQPLEQTGIKQYVEKLNGEIRVENLCFHYPDAPYPVLSDLSFRCAPGEMVGIIGRSGSGKSTVLRLISALERPDSGKIYFDGIPLESLDFTTLRRRIGVVLQSSAVFTGTVRDNIYLGRRASKEELDRALEVSMFSEVLKTMPMGLDSILTGGGGTLSGGEQQRLLLARALLTDVDILLLDEATSALDSLTQAAVMGRLEAMKITRIVVAHRLETVRKSNEILVVKNGRVVERGTYEDLAASSVVFNALRAPDETEKAEIFRRQKK